MSDARVPAHVLQLAYRAVHAPLLALDPLSGFQFGLPQQTVRANICTISEMAPYVLSCAGLCVSACVFFFFVFVVLVLLGMLIILMQ